MEVKDGQAIVLLEDVNLQYSLYPSTSANFTLDLNGKRISETVGADSLGTSGSFPLSCLRKDCCNEPMNTVETDTQAGGVFEMYIWGLSIWWFVGVGAALVVGAKSRLSSYCVEGKKRINRRKT